MDIPGVPDKITREAYVQVIKALGLDPDHIRSLEFRVDGIYAEVYAPDEDGKRFLDTAPGSIGRPATHRIYIPVGGSE